MIDSIVKIAERLTDLLKYREQKREKRFKAFVEPTYAVLKDVHKDYLQILENAKRDLESDVDLGTIVSRLEIRGLEFEAIRRSVESQASALMSYAARDELYDFWLAVLTYFKSVSVRPNSPVANLAVVRPDRVQSIWRRVQGVWRKTTLLMSTLGDFEGSVIKRVILRVKISNSKSSRDDLSPTESAEARRLYRLKLLGAVDSGLTNIRTCWDKISQTYALALAASVR